MSKKKFKAGLESLFGEPAIGGMSPFLVEEKTVAVAEKEQVTPKEEKIKPITKRAKKRSSSKNFTSDLETLFSDALDKEQANQQKKTKTSSTITKKPTEKPIIGLDALIRKTSEGNYETKYASTPLKKRLTITMERQKLEALKTIARKKKAYLRAIIGVLVTDYSLSLIHVSEPTRAERISYAVF